jgi:hypothetical protein
MPTLPKRRATFLSQVDDAVPKREGAAFGAFADPVAQVGRCHIPGATDLAPPAAAIPPPPSSPWRHGSTAPAGRRGQACSTLVTVNVTGTPPSFSSFYGNISAALGTLQFGNMGAFCAWTSLQPDATPMAPWAQHGAVDSWKRVASPSGAVFSLLQSLGSELLETTVKQQAPATQQVHLALGTLRRWATQTTVSVVVNASDTATSTAAVCLDIVGLAPGVAEMRCGSGGGREAQAAATAVELMSGRGQATTTRMLPCEPGAAAGVVRLGLATSPGGTATAVSFAVSHL